MQPRRTHRTRAPHPWAPLRRRPADPSSPRRALRCSESTPSSNRATEGDTRDASSLFADLPLHAVVTHLHEVDDALDVRPIAIELPLLVTVLPDLVIRPLAT